MTCPRGAEDGEEEGGGRWLEDRQQEGAGFAAAEGPGGDFVDGDVYEVADAVGGFEVGELAVAGAAGGAAVLLALDEHLDGLAEEALVDADGGGGVDGLDGLEALFLEFAWDIVFELAEGVGAGAGGVGGDVNDIELHAL